MKTIFFILIFLFLPLFLFSLSPFTFIPHSLSSLLTESNEEESEFEFPPITLPLIDAEFINSHKHEIIALSSMCGIIGIGFIIYGIQELFAQVENGYYSYEIKKGIFFIFSGLIVGGISLTFFKSAIDTHL